MFELNPSPVISYAMIQLVAGYYMEMGTFQAPQMRPYELKAPEMDYTELVRGISKMVVNPGRRAQGVLSQTDRILGRTASILRPSQLSQGDASISGSWTDPRYTVVLQFEVTDYSGSVKRLIVSGVTDPVDMSTGHLLPHDMAIWPTTLQTLTFNSLGMRLTDSRMVVADTRKSVNGLTGARYSSLADLAQQPVTIRPCDVTIAAQCEPLRGHDDDDWGSPTVTLNASSVISPSGVTTTIDNNRPEGWLGLLLDAWLSTDPNDPEDVQLQAMSACLASTEVSSTPILARLSAEQFDNYTGAAFTWGDLLRMHPEADTVVKPVQVTSDGLSNFHNTHDWLSEPDKTLFITSLGNQLTSLMDNYGLTEVYFTVTNDVVSGLGYDAHQFEWVSAPASLNPSANLEANAKLFMRAIQTVMDELSLQSARPYALSVFCQRYHSSRIWGHVDELGDQSRVWTLPVAAEMSWSPTVAAGTGHLNDLAVQTTALIDGCNDARTQLLKGNQNSPRIQTGSALSTASQRSRPAPNAASSSSLTGTSTHLNFDF